MAYPLEQKHIDALVGMGLNPDNYELSDDFLTFRRKTEQPVSPAMDADTPQPKLSVGTPVEDRNFEAFAKSAIHSAPAAALSVATMAVAAPLVAAGPAGWLTLAALGLASGLAGQYGSEKLREVTMSDEQLADFNNLMTANPTAAMLGSLASMPVGGFNPSPSNVVKALGSTGKLATGMRLMDEEIPNLANVAMGTGMGTGLGIAQPLIMEGRMPSLGEIGMAAGTGALFNKPNAIGRSLGFQDPSVVSRLPNETTQITGRPFTTSIRTSPEAMAWDVLNTAQAELPAHTGEIPVGKRALQQMEQVKPVKVPEAPVPEIKTAPPQPKLAVAPEPISVVPEPTPAKPTVAPVEQLALEGAKEAKALETPTKQTKVAKLKLEEIRAKWDNASAEERAIMAGEDYSYLAPVDWADLNGPERKGIAKAIRAKQPKQSESSPFREEKMRPLSEYERQAVEDVKKSGVPLTPTFEWFHLMRAFNAKIRGAKTKLSKQLEARGQFDPTKDEITLSAQRGKLFALDTPAHEGIHAFQKFLRESPVEADRAFATTMEDVVAQSPEFQRINAERAKVGMEPWTPEEFITTESGANFIRRRLLRKDEATFTNWFKDMRAYLRTRFVKNGTLDDYRRMLTYRYMTDKPTGNAAIRETPVKAPVTPVVQRSDQSAFEPEGQSDYARYQQLAARLVKPDGSIDMEAWRELEAVKNRNQGMPPAKPVEDTTPSPTITPKAAAVKPVRNTLEEPPADVSLNSEQSPFASEKLRAIQDEFYPYTKLREPKNEKDYSAWESNKKWNTIYEATKDDDNRRTALHFLTDVASLTQEWNDPATRNFWRNIMSEDNLDALANFARGTSLPEFFKNPENKLYYAVRDRTTGKYFTMDNSERAKEGKIPVSEYPTKENGVWGKATGLDQAKREIVPVILNPHKGVLDRTSLEGFYVGGAPKDHPDYDVHIRRPDYAKLDKLYPDADAFPGKDIWVNSEAELIELSKANDIIANKRYSEQSPFAAESQVFKTQTEKELERPMPFNITPSKRGDIDVTQFRNKLAASPFEQELMSQAGIDKFLAGRTSIPQRELLDWVRANGPKVTVETYGMEGKVSEAKREYDRMTHEWYEKLPQEQRMAVKYYVQGNKLSERWQKALLEASLGEGKAKVDRYYEIYNKQKVEPRDTSPRATSYYNTVSALPTNEPMPEWTTSKEGKNVQRVDVVVPSSQWTKDALLHDLPQDADKTLLWQPDNLHENLPNTLGWAMIQYKTGPKGEKIALIAEAQSRWGQYVRDKKIEQDLEQYGGPTATQRAEAKQKINHPLLRDYNRLILKAAIDQARKEGATHIMVSDAETAMMTEGHDLSPVRILRNPKTGEETTWHQGELMGDMLETLRKRGFTEERRVPEQEPGMRLNYDTILPRIAEELTGVKGERVSLGEHKNAYRSNLIGEETMSDGSRKKATRDNLIFRNPDGTPKTDVSGLMFDIARPASKRASGEPFSLTGKRYSEQSPFAREQTETPEFKRWFGDSKVVDSDGKPLVVYHGTSKDRDFKAFNKKSGGSWFVDAPDMASAYAQDNDFMRKLGYDENEMPYGENVSSRVIPAYLSMQNPKVLSEAEMAWWRKQTNYRDANTFLMAKAASEGHDGLVFNYKDYTVYAVKRPTQIKSAISNSGEFSLTNPDITKSESSPFAEEFYGKNLIGRGLTHTVAANIDRIATMGEPGKKAAGALTKFYEKNRQYRGELEQTFIRKLIGLRPSRTIGEYWRQDNPDFRRVVEFRDRVQDGESLTPESFLTPKQREINDLVTENNAQSWALMKSFPKLAALHKGEAGDSANYLAHVLSREAAQEIAEHPNSEKSKAYKRDFIEYQLANSKTPNEAEAIKQWQILRGGLSKETHNIAEKFGPIDKSAGVGLPRSMREKSLLDRMSRFNRRYARRIAYHEAVELNGDAEQALFNPESGLESNAEVKDVLEDIFGVRERDEAVRQAALGVVRAGMLGPLTGAKDFVSNFTLGLQHQDLGQLIPSVQFALKNAKDNYARAVGTGVARYNISGLEMGEGGITQSINFLHRLRDVMNTVQGRQALEMATRTIAFGQGKYLAVDAFHSLANARMTPQKLKFLKDFAPDYKSYKGKMPDEKTLDLIAARYVESVQGTYDYRGLPSIAMKGSLTPYLALARWNIEKFNNFTKNVVEPARQGQWTPLLNSTIGMLAGGAAVTALVEAATGRKDRMPKVAEIKEALPEEQAQMIAYKLAGLASMSGYAGALGDVIKSVMDKMHGNRPQTWSNPLIEAGVTGWNTAYDMVEAIQNGDVPAFTDAMNAILEDYFQSYRIAVAQLSPEKQKELQARNESRDLRVYKSGRGLPTSKYTRERANPFMNPEVRRFKETEDVAEAMRLGRKLTSEAVAEAEGDPARLRSGLTRLKINSLATMPSPERDPRLFRDYTDYLGRTQGEDVAAERRARFLKKRAFNSAKASMIP